MTFETSVSPWQVLSQGNHQMIQGRKNFLFGRGVGFSFWGRRCPHIVQDGSFVIAPDLVDIFQNAIQKQAHLNLTENPGLCGVEGHIKHCGNTRGALWECRCAELNRITRPQARIAFEDKVIEKFFEIPCVRAACEGRGSFDVNLAVLASGGLLAEEILLYRLIGLLYGYKATGTIRLFLINRNYHDPIAQSQPDRTMQQFMAEVTDCLPPGIELEATFLQEAHEYIYLSTFDSSYRHDLLIGAESEDGQQFMSIMQLVARRCTVPVLLQKTQGHAQEYGNAAGNWETIYNRGEYSLPCSR